MGDDKKSPTEEMAKQLIELYGHKWAQNVIVLSKDDITRVMARDRSPRQQHPDPVIPDELLRKAVSRESSRVNSQDQRQVNTDIQYHGARWDDSFRWG